MAKQIDKTLYNENSIESLDPLTFTRLKPGVYAGDTTYSTQLLIEILSNSIDEYRLGHGTNIDIFITDKRMSVRDCGQGFIPNSFREDGKTILEAAFSVINTSGKYREDGTYEGTSLGSFGIGSKLACFLSHWLDVTTFRDGIYENVKFKEGVFYHRNVGKIKDLGTNDEYVGGVPTHGTWVTWEPSEEFFTHVEVEIPKVRDLCETITALCPGLHINLITKNGIEKFYSENGINDLLDSAVANKEILKNRFNMKFEQGKNKMDMVFTYTSMYSFTIVPYVNTGLTESGPHITQVKSLLTREFNKFFREKKWLKDKDENLTGDDIQEGLYVIFNITAPNVAYNAQVKTTVVKLDMTPFTGAITENIQYWLANNEKEIKSIFDKAAAARKAREAAKKARDAARGVGKKEKKKLLNLPTKLVDANGKNRLNCELLIAEGDSAASGLVEARDPDIQAIFPIRGKIIACYKNTPEKIFANAEVVNIIKALGLDFDKKTGKLFYDRSKLRYGKILLCADGDPDGQSIKNLLLEFFWWLCPELVLNGHIYSTLPPLFRITTKKNEYIFLKDAAALEDYKAKHRGESYLVNRNKGLGEQDAHELHECLINPETRNISQIIVSNKEEANQLMECLMGPSVPPRRAYLLKHAEEASNE